MNRQILTAALFQHSSRVQPFKQESLDSIVERILYFSQDKSISIAEIQTTFIDLVRYTIPLLHFENSIDRLLKDGIIEQDKDDEDKFVLSIKRKDEIEISENSIVQKQKSLIDRLFKYSPEKKALYSEPFWFAVSFIFSNIGDYSAKIVNGKIDKEQILFPILDKCIEECKNVYSINFDFFKQKLIEFFSELNDPLFNETKCVLAQNYFIAKSVGINPSSENFSKDVFNNLIVYLDTNVILAIVSQYNRKHGNSVAFLKAIKKLNSKLCITNATIIEYETWVQNEFGRIRSTSKQIPKKTKSKIESPVYQDYYHLCQAKIENDEECELEEIISDLEKHYFNYKNILKKYIAEENIEYIDNAWFDTVVNDPSFDSFVKLIKEKYREVSSRDKGDGAAVHDGKVLLWLNKISKETGVKHIFVTTDTSMPLIHFEENENTNNIVLEAILQWLLPLTNGHSDYEIDKTISEFLKQRILPKEFIFEIKDFLIFDHLHMECQELPAEDVENCIIYLKKNASNLNPNSAADREKFASEIAKYFIDPGKKFKLELSNKEKENEELKIQLGDVFNLLTALKELNSEKDNKLSELKAQHKEEMIILQEGHKTEITGIKDLLNDVSGELREIKAEQKRKVSEKEYSDWQRPSKIAFALFVILLLFGVLQLLPNWKLNFPAQLVEYINEIRPENEAKFRLWIAINIFLTTSLIVTFFVFSYQRLFNKEKKKNKRNELGL
jgi:predicted nucleic acid-binding protein